MATANGVNYTKFTAGKMEISQGKIFTGLKVISDTYEATAVAIAGTIAMGADLPDGAVIHGVTISFDALGASSTIKVGDSDDDDRYKAATSTAAAGSNTNILVEGLGYVIGTNDGDNTILLTVGGAAITGTIKAVITYA